MRAQSLVKPFDEVLVMGLDKQNIINDNNDWYLVNDTIMGGLSVSQIEWKQGDKNIEFRGEVKLKNNAGFVSASLVVANNTFNNNDHFCIKVKGDGRQYQFRVRTQKNPQKLAYSVEFKTIKNEWQTIVFSSLDFVAKHRGRNIISAPPLINSQIEQVAFLLADKKNGPFKLNIASISAC